MYKEEINKQYILKLINNLDMDSIFVVDSINNKQYTYRKLFSLAYEISLKQRKCGVDKYIVLLDNSIELFLFYFSSLFSNKIIIPLDPLKQDDEVNKIIQTHDDSILVNINNVNEFMNFEDMKELTNKMIFYYIRNMDVDKSYLITYTSGSTGNPKGVVHSAFNLFYAAIIMGKSLKYTDNCVFGHIMPMTYMAGILNSIFMPFIMKSKIVIMNRFTAEQALHFWKNVMSYSINTFWFSPTMLHVLLYMDKKGQVKNYFASNKPIISVGTAPLSLELRNKFENKYDVKLLQSYGLSETLFISTECNDDEIKDSSVGKILDNVIIKFDSDNQILVKVPWLMKGYYDCNMSDYMIDDFYKTGDLGVISDNKLFIKGRKKDLIIKGGINISPSDIENKIISISDVSDCYIASIISNNEERIVCWYKSNKILLESEINDIIVKELGKYYKVDYFMKMTEIYKNLNGKVDKNKLISSFYKQFRGEE
ncbi:long-chain acyl-CoA synthetase [Anaerosporobacter mobilis DSM 15930]|jgi:long-chain acyl-CoA synthetase|uniref:Long-chain acyl-CoA synthetase n=1 Tax=Anaerosporobacter mobilis DSM 15930 TaxID=1120996 RepID=A0A1M7LNN4_9FIRM|nr:class I adenylate-forming enzyme family protein [Anaerosporobacter mobilis]SHM79764.1 long-chain acyl-CoA synthetase [Anaerosporobacter mobilis DSM 15930]